MVGSGEIVLLLLVVVLVSLSAVALVGLGAALFFWRRRSSPVPSAAPAAPQVMGEKKAFDLSDWDEWSDEEREARLRALLERVGVVLGLEGARVKPRPDDGEVDLRGRLSGRPVRLEVSEAGWLGVEVKQPSGLPGLSLSWNPEALAKEADPDDDWADRDELRVFVAPGVYVEGDAESVEENLTLLDRIAPAERARLFTLMAQQKLYLVTLLHEETSARSEPDLTDMPDPIEGLVGLVRTVCALADIAATVSTIAGGDADRSGSARQQAPHPTTRCRYCTALYVLREPFRCPNCGAPA